MNSRFLLMASSWALLTCLCSSVWAGSITFTSTVGSGRVDLHVVVIDDGGAPDCTCFMIQGGATTFAVPRVLGTSTYDFVDVAVQSNRTYFYNLSGVRFPFPLPCDTAMLPFALACDSWAFQQAFQADWYPGFITIANVGPGPIPQRRGVLTSQYGEPWSNGIGLIDVCNQDPWDGIGVHLSDSARQYLDTNVVVLTFGTWFEVSRQHGFGLNVDDAIPTDCPNLAVQSRPWSQVKLLYRD